MVDVSTLKEAISFPSTEPATSVPMRNYDLTYLATNQPGQASAFPVQDLSPSTAASRQDTIDVRAAMIDVHGGTSS
jgi:hypothetical protein